MDCTITGNGAAHVASNFADGLPIFSADDGGRLPLAMGILGGELVWRRDHDGDPTREIAECRILISCPFCGQQHEHGWRLDGQRRTERRRAHCGEGEYRVRPRAWGCHKHSHFVLISRPARGRAAQ